MKVTFPNRTRISMGRHTLRLLKQLSSIPADGANRNFSPIESRNRVLGTWTGDFSVRRCFADANGSSAQVLKGRVRRAAETERDRPGCGRRDSVVDSREAGFAV